MTSDDDGAFGDDFEVGDFGEDDGLEGEGWFDLDGQSAEDEGEDGEGLGEDPDDTDPFLDIDASTTTENIPPAAAHANSLADTTTKATTTVVTPQMYEKLQMVEAEFHSITQRIHQLEKTAQEKKLQLFELKANKLRIEAMFATHSSLSASSQPAPAAPESPRGADKPYPPRPPITELPYPVTSPMAPHNMSFLLSLLTFLGFLFLISSFQVVS